MENTHLDEKVTDKKEDPKPIFPPSSDSPWTYYILYKWREKVLIPNHLSFLLELEECLQHKSE